MMFVRKLPQHMLLPSSEPTIHPGLLDFGIQMLTSMHVTHATFVCRQSHLMNYHALINVESENNRELNITPLKTPIGLQALPLEFTTQRRITRPRRGSTHERETDLKKVIAHRVQHFITLKITFDFLSFRSKHFEMVLTVPSHCTSEHQSPEWRWSSSYTSSRSTKHCKQWKIGLN